MNKITFHKRNLPHYYIPNSTYFITFRIKDSIPLKELLKLKNRFDKLRFKCNSETAAINQNYFFEYDSLIHKYGLGKYLDNKEVAEILTDIIHKYNGKDYKLICYSIMPNHVHLIFHLLDTSRSMSKIMQSIKRSSAFYINKYLNRKGSFWQAESYDHIIRDQDELEKMIEYTLLNPVKVGLVEDWRDFENNYLSESW